MKLSILESFEDLPVFEAGLSYEEKPTTREIQDLLNACESRTPLTPCCGSTLGRLTKVLPGRESSGCRMSRVGTAFEVTAEEEDGAAKKFVPVWQQDVRDDEGRRRFHGAFTGGFSAGYFNTVGTKEGWTPSTFTSSRSQRAERPTATPQQFMDAEDYEGAGVGGRALSSRVEYDVFASRAPTGSAPPTATAALASLLAAPKHSIGVKLLRLMGWRDGRHIAPRKAPMHLAPPIVSSAAPTKKVYGVSLIDDLRDEKAEEDEEVAPKEEAPVAVISFKQKNNTYGIGFDPLRSAPEMRAIVQRREAEKEANKSERPIMAMASAGKGGMHVPSRFGLGALEKGEGAWSAEAYEGQEMTYDRVLDEEANDDAPRKGQQSAAQRALDQLMPDRKELSSNSNVAATPAKSRDGRVLLKGFRLAERTTLTVKNFVTPPMPASYKPLHTISRPRIEASRATTSQARASLLGEAALPDQAKSVTKGGLLSAEDHRKLVAQTIVPKTNPAAAAEIARIGGMMSSRFVTAGTSFSSTASVTADGKTGRAESSAEAAARSGMYGKFTRTEERWRPEKLLCKRWNIRDPWQGRDDAPRTEKEKQAAALAELVNAAQASVARSTTDDGANLGANASVAVQVEAEEREAAAAASPAPESVKPSIDLFKAIFADDDDDSPLFPPIVPPAAALSQPLAKAPTAVSTPSAPSSLVPPSASSPQQVKQTELVTQQGTTKRPRASDFM